MTNFLSESPSGGDFQEIQMKLAFIPVFVVAFAVPGISNAANSTPVQGSGVQRWRGFYRVDQFLFPGREAHLYSGEN